MIVSSFVALFLSDTFLCNTWISLHMAVLPNPSKTRLPYQLLGCVAGVSCLWHHLIPKLKVFDNMGTCILIFFQTFETSNYTSEKAKWATLSLIWTAFVFFSASPTRKICILARKVTHQPANENIGEVGSMVVCFVMLLRESLTCSWKSRLFHLRRSLTVSFSTTDCLIGSM